MTTRLNSKRKARIRRYAAMTYGVPSEKERQRWLRPASRDTPGPYFDLGIIVFCLLFACLSLVV